MIHIDDTTQPASPWPELMGDVNGRAARLKRRGRVRIAGSSGLALAVVLALFAASTPGAKTDVQTLLPASESESESTSEAGAESVEQGSGPDSEATPPRGAARNKAGSTPNSPVADAGTSSVPTVLPPPAVRPSTTPALSDTRAKAIFFTGDGLYEMMVDGTGRRKLYGKGARAKWSPDGNAVIVVDYSDGGDDLVVLDPKTGTTEQVFRGEEGDSVYAVDWLPDNRSVVALRRVGLVNPKWELWVLDVRSGDSRRLRSVEAVSHPSVAPDGRIAYSCQVDHQSRLCLTDDKGRDLGMLPYGGYSPTYEWSPDGRWIVTTAWVQGGVEIVLLRADGPTERRVVFSQNLEAGNGLGNVTWFPDGSRIAFDVSPAYSVGSRGGERPCSASPCPDDAGIWSVRLDGSDVRPIVGGERAYAPDLAKAG